jgi:hypothetical protein
MVSGVASLKKIAQLPVTVLKCLLVVLHVIQKVTALPLLLVEKVHLHNFNTKFFIIIL